MMAILKLTDICKDYQQGKEPVRVLKNISMTVEKGDYLAFPDETCQEGVSTTREQPVTGETEAAEGGVE